MQSTKESTNTKIRRTKRKQKTEKRKEDRNLLFFRITGCEIEEVIYKRVQPASFLGGGRRCGAGRMTDLMA